MFRSPANSRHDSSVVVALTDPHHYFGVDLVPVDGTEPYLALPFESVRKSTPAPAFLQIRSDL